eukprot:3773975-Rhodomonas_salina.1
MERAAGGRTAMSKRTPTNDCGRKLSEIVKTKRKTRKLGNWVPGYPGTRIPILKECRTGFRASP